MTLKEKFQLWHDEPTNETVAENIIDLEKITEDFAVEFLRWFIINSYKHQGNSFEEYLIIFKK